MSELAHEGKVSWGFLQQLETGRALPSAVVLYDLACALDVSMDFLMGRLVPHGKKDNQVTATIMRQVVRMHRIAMMMRECAVAILDETGEYIEPTHKKKRLGDE